MLVNFYLRGYSLT